MVFEVHSPLPPDLQVYRFKNRADLEPRHVPDKAKYYPIFFCPEIASVVALIVPLVVQTLLP